MFDSFGLAQGEKTAAVPQGVQTRTADGASICEFVGEVPDALVPAFSVPPLEGWQCLAGAYRISDRFSMDGEVEGTGLTAFAHGKERLLTLLVLETKTKAWRAVPVGKTALLPGRELYITYESGNNCFNITYPVSDTEQERFQCRILSLGITPATNGLLCELMEYRYVNTLENRSVAIAYDFDNPFSSAYTVTAIRDGNKVRTRYPALASNLLDYIDASAFPKTEEACEAASTERSGIPEGYAFPWLHVRIGQAEGYMSGNYVAYQAGADPNQRHIALGMAQCKTGAALKGNASIFAQTVTDLPAGTVVRVLAETGNWLQVSVPEDPADWMMRPARSADM